MEKKDKDRPPASLNGADWGSSGAKHLIAQDMLDGIVPTDKKIKDVHKLFQELYAHQPEFKNFPFDKERYKARFSRLQTSVGKVMWAAKYDSDCLKEARAKYPKKTHGPTGMILWEGSEADACLEIDMANNKHLLMTPEKLRDSKPCYKEFSIKRFKKRIDQKREAAKPYGQNPMQAAAKKAKKGRTVVKNRPEISRAGEVNPYNN